MAVLMEVKEGIHEGKAMKKHNKNSRKPKLILHLFLQFKKE